MLLLALAHLTHMQQYSGASLVVYRAECFHVLNIDINKLSSFNNVTTITRLVDIPRYEI